MRLKYIENPPKNYSGEDRRILEKVKEHRGDLGLLPVDLVLLHAPRVAEGKLGYYSPCVYCTHLTFFRLARPFWRYPFQDLVT